MPRSRQKILRWRSILLAGALLLTWLCILPQSQAEDNSELAKQTQNPVADLISIPFQNNTNFGLSQTTGRKTC